MPLTSSRRVSVFESTEINNKNIACVQPKNAYSVVGVTNSAATSGIASTSSPMGMPPMVTVSKSALCNDKSTESLGVAQDIAAITPAAAAAASKKEKSTGTVKSSTASSKEHLRDSNVKLIKLVRRRPCLYDKSHPDSTKKGQIKKKWAEVARACNTSVAICKSRWRNIRAAFARSTGSYRTRSGPNRQKSYYLHQHLEFLIDPINRAKDSHLKTSDSSDDDSSSEGQDEDVVAPKDSAVTNGTDHINDAGELSTDVVMEDSTPMNPSSPEASTDDVSQHLTGLKMDRFDKIPDDAELLFVKSLYYDMSGLEPAQRLRLKRFIYEALEQISASELTPSIVSLTPAQKKFLSHIHNFSDVQLQHLTRYAQSLQNSTVLLNDVAPHPPDQSRMPLTNDVTNGNPPFVFTVKDEQLDGQTTMTFSPPS